MRLSNKLRTRRRGVVMRRDVVSIGPNEACPCGSGRKYKRCCAVASGIWGWWRRKRALRIKARSRDG
ncbi:MAG: SEC-C metal-binding domain-containing protein [Thermoanaerobaculia bacterium]